ncbi:hypothetical protein Focb16_v000498 [Fusarium oxysporum f. sp. cubense]|uniref:Uncharacterized protein n=1 Tax=Fusarium oxysporum f. sp. cubense TaxID=61366 RepID=A0A559LCB3_FUSOC|nr:hypothetical protein Focb16_v000498 [Fusarium oxysporum f. sp. cubense]
MSSDDESYGPSYTYPTPEEAFKPYQGYLDTDTGREAIPTAKQITKKAIKKKELSSEVGDVFSRRGLSLAGPKDVPDDTESEDEADDPVLMFDPREEEGEEREKEGSDSNELTSHNLFKVIRDMEKIDLKTIDMMQPEIHEEQIQKLVTDDLSPMEQSSLEMTQERVSSVLEDISVNQHAVEAMLEQRDVSQAIERYRRWVKHIIDGMVVFALAAGARKNVPVDMRGWILFLQANAHRYCRERIVDFLTNFTITPAAIQFACGQSSWRPDIFDGLVKIDMDNPDICGDCVSSYLAIGHGQDATHFSYSGSATNTTARGRIGEALRMKQHANILELGADEIRRRRAAGVSNVFGVHKCLSEVGTGNYSFMAMSRIPIDVGEPSSAVAATMALLSETLHMVLLGTVSPDPVPRKGRAVEFMTHTRLLMTELRPTDCPLPPWVGTNKVLPLLQMPKPVWALLRQGYKQSPRPELLNHLRNHFDSTRALFLSDEVCKEVLSKTSRKAERADICNLRRLYASILNGRGLAYKNDYQAFLYLHCVLWHAVIQTAEKGIVWFHNETYHMEISKLDWVQVAEIAQSVVPPALHNVFTTTGCKELYNETRGLEFNKSVFFPSVWNRLREGVPQTFAYAKAKLHFEKNVRLRIKAISRGVLLTNLIGQQIVERDQVGVKLPSTSNVEVNDLYLEIMEQLKTDFGISTHQKPRIGTWQDPQFIRYIIRELKIARGQLKRGISLADEEQWLSLQELGPDWVKRLEIPETIVEIPDDDKSSKEWLDPQMKAVQPWPVTATDQEVLEKLKCLENNQVEPGKIVNMESRARSKAQVKRTADVPFDLCDDSGTPLGQRVFSSTQKKGKKKKEASEEQDPSGTCDLCGVFWADLACHALNCCGRCESCDKDKLPCIRIPEDPLQCVHCDEQSTRCANFTHLDNADPSVATASCPRCVSVWSHVPRTTSLTVLGGAATVKEKVSTTRVYERVHIRNHATTVSKEG